MNTFFFGYLPYKTRRVVRTILFIILFIISLWAFEAFQETGSGYVGYYLTFYVTLIGIVSYVLEPFIKYKK